MKQRIAVLAAALTAVAAIGVGSATAAGGTWTLNVVHGISLPAAANVGVCAKPSSSTSWLKIIDAFNFKDVRTFPGLAEGNWDAKVVAPGADCSSAPALGLGFTNAAVPAGANVSVVAYETTSGGVSLGVKINNTAPTKWNSARLTAYHFANAPAVDIRGGLILWIPTLFANVSATQGGDRELFPASYTVAITPAGAGIFKVVKLARLSLPSNTNTIVYAVGSLQAGTFSLVTQQIPVG